MVLAVSLQIVCHFNLDSAFIFTYAYIKRAFDRSSDSSKTSLIPRSIACNINLKVSLNKSPLAILGTPPNSNSLQRLYCTSAGLPQDSGYTVHVCFLLARPSPHFNLFVPGNSDFRTPRYHPVALLDFHLKSIRGNFACRLSRLHVVSGASLSSVLELPLKCLDVCKLSVHAWKRPGPQHLPKTSALQRIGMLNKARPFASVMPNKGVGLCSSLAKPRTSRAYLHKRLSQASIF